MKMDIKLEDLLIETNISIKKAMKVLNKVAVGCLIVTDKNKNLIGTLSDGDIRRSILKGCDFSEEIKNAYNKKPHAIFSHDYIAEQAEKDLNRLNIDLIPIIDKNKRVIDFFNNKGLYKAQQIKKLKFSIPTVIMAGGEGTRMEPFTKVLPKPLIPVGEMTIIEHIINKFSYVGCKNFYLSVNYKKEINKAYFKNLNPNYSIKYLEEDQPLGTAGALRFLKDNIKTSFFSVNCDVIIKADLADIYDFHMNGDFVMTIVASAKEYIIPYGVCELNKKGCLSNVNEKPVFDFLINTGLYVIRPDILDRIPKNKLYHITHLINDLLSTNSKIGVYPINEENWTDIGQWDEYKNAISLL